MIQRSTVNTNRKEKSRSGNTLRYTNSLPATQSQARVSIPAHLRESIDKLGPDNMQSKLRVPYPIGSMDYNRYSQGHQRHDGRLMTDFEELEESSSHSQNDSMILRDIENPSSDLYCLEQNIDSLKLQ